MAAFHAHVAYRPHLAHTDAGTKLGEAATRMFATVRTWCDRASTRRELRALHDRLLPTSG